MARALIGTPFANQPNMVHQQRMPIPHNWNFANAGQQMAPGSNGLPIIPNAPLPTGVMGPPQMPMGQMPVRPPRPMPGQMQVQQMPGQMPMRQMPPQMPVMPQPNAAAMPSRPQMPGIPLTSGTLR